DPGVDDRLVLLEAELLQHAVHALRAEDAHQVVLERQIEARMAGIALAARTTAELIVDPPALVALGADDVEAAGPDRLLLELARLGADLRLAGGALRTFRHVSELLPDAHVGVAAELDVGAAAGHVGGDGDGAGDAGLGDDVGFLLVIAGVEDGEGLVADRLLAEQLGEVLRIGEVALLPALLPQEFGEELRLLDRGGADQHRLAALLAVLDQPDDRLVFLAGGPVDLVVVVDAGDLEV